METITKTALAKLSDSLANHPWTTYGSAFMLVALSSYKLFPTVRFWCKGFMLLTLLSIVSILGIFISTSFYFLGMQIYVHSVVGYINSRLTSLCFGIRFEVLNEDIVKKMERSEPAIYLCNHQTALDLPISGAHFPLNTSMMAKKSLQWAPFLGLYLRMAQIAFIERSNINSAIETTRKLAENMKKNNMGVWIFVEGTRSELKTPDLLPFKKGPFHLAVETGFPIVPVVFSNTSNIFSMKYKVFNQGTVKVKYLEPIPTKGKTKEDIDELMKQTRESMLTNLIEISKN